MLAGEGMIFAKPLAASEYSRGDSKSPREFVSVYSSDDSKSSDELPPRNFASMITNVQDGICNFGNTIQEF